MGARATTSGAVSLTVKDVLAVLPVSVVAVWWQVLTIFWLQQRRLQPLQE